MCMLLLLAVTSVCGQYRKSVSVLGDSYSTFKSYVVPDTNYVWYSEDVVERTDVNDVCQTWWHLLIKNNGLRLCVNNSFSGATICNTGYKKEDYSDRSFCTRLNMLGSPDILLIFGATNDSWAGSPVGEYKYSGWTSSDLYSFRPAMAYMLSNVKKRYPNVDIYFILNDGLSKDITVSCREICEHYAVKCINLKNIDKRSGHPTVKGMKQIASQVAAVMFQENRLP
nr:SGNH/GDSL hydrolase family protein [Xylanibacter muris]